MDLTIREAATVLGVRPRTVRDRLKRGTLTGHKRGGRWVIPRHALPLNDVQRQALHAKADSLRDALEAALPAPARRGASQRLRDLDVYRLGLGCGPCGVPWRRARGAPLGWGACGSASPSGASSCDRGWTTGSSTPASWRRCAGSSTGP